MNSGPTIVEPTCGSTKVENIFMAGNERALYNFALPNSTIKSGYSLIPQDKFILQTQLQNLHDTEKWVWVTLEYQYMDGPQPDYKQGKTVWMTIGYPLAACGDEAKINAAALRGPWGPSNLTESSQPKIEQFSEHSLPWAIPKSGYLLKTGGHMHDGGVSTDIFHEGKLVCHSVPTYSKTAKAAAGGHNHGGRSIQMRQAGSPDVNVEHIESQDYCTFPDGVALNAGDSLWIAANYDFKKYPG
jgi:hypothetical protein